MRDHTKRGEGFAVENAVENDGFIEYAILTFSLDGQWVNQLDRGLAAGSLCGMAFGSDGKLYLVDTLGSRVRIDPN